VKPPKVLHYFRCRVCASILITGIKATNYEPCNGCRSYMRLLFSEPIETPEQEDCAQLVAKHGRVFRWSPSTEPLAYTPSRRKPPGPLLTPEQIEEAKRRRDALWAEEEARMEAAYKAAEEANR
jgi:hypothetical protein